MFNDVVEFLSNNAESARDFANANSGFCLVCGALVMFMLTAIRTLRPRRTQPAPVAAVEQQPPTPPTPREIVDRYIRNALATAAGWTKVVQQGNTSYRCQSEEGKALSFHIRRQGDKFVGVSLYLVGSNVTSAILSGAKFDANCEFARMAVAIESAIRREEEDRLVGALAAKLVPPDNSDLITKYISAALSLPSGYWEKGAGNLIMCKEPKYKVNVFCTGDRSYFDYFVDGVSVRDKIKPAHAVALNTQATPLLGLFISSTEDANTRVMDAVRGA